MDNDHLEAEAEKRSHGERTHHGQQRDTESPLSTERNPSMPVNSSPTQCRSISEATAIHGNSSTCSDLEPTQSRSEGTTTHGNYSTCSDSEPTQHLSANATIGIGSCTDEEVSNRRSGAALQSNGESPPRRTAPLATGQPPVSGSVENPCEGLHRETSEGRSWEPFSELPVDVAAFAMSELSSHMPFRNSMSVICTYPNWREVMFMLHIYDVAASVASDLQRMPNWFDLEQAASKLGHDLTSVTDDGSRDALDFMMQATIFSVERPAYLNNRPVPPKIFHQMVITAAEAAEVHLSEQRQEWFDILLKKFSPAQARFIIFQFHEVARLCPENYGLITWGQCERLLELWIRPRVLVSEDLRQIRLKAMPINSAVKRVSCTRFVSAVAKNVPHTMSTRWAKFQISNEGEATSTGEATTEGVARSEHPSRSFKWVNALGLGMDRKNDTNRVNFKYERLFDGMTEAEHLKDSIFKVCSEKLVIKRGELQTVVCTSLKNLPHYLSRMTAAKIAQSLSCFGSASHELIQFEQIVKEIDTASMMVKKFI